MKLNEMKSEMLTAGGAGAYLLIESSKSTSDERFWGMVGVGAFLVVLAWLGRIIVKWKRINAGGDGPMLSIPSVWNDDDLGDEPEIYETTSTEPGDKTDEA